MGGLHDQSVGSQWTPVSRPWSRPRPLPVSASFLSSVQGPIPLPCSCVSSSVPGPVSQHLLFHFFSKAPPGAEVRIGKGLPRSDGDRRLSQALGLPERKTDAARHPQSLPGSVALQPQSCHSHAAPETLLPSTQTERRDVRAEQPVSSGPCPVPPGSASVALTSSLRGPWHSPQVTEGKQAQRGLELDTCPTASGQGLTEGQGCYVEGYVAALHVLT